MYTKTNKICYGTFDCDELKEYLHEFTSDEINEMTQKISDAVNEDIHNEVQKLYKENKMGKLSQNIESCCTHDRDNIKTGDILAYDKNNNTFIFEVTKIADGIVYYNKVYNVRAQQMYVCNNENLVVLYDEIPLLYYATQQQCELYSHPEIDYIINTLKEWEQQFPNIVLHYWFENDTQYHIVVVEPCELQKNYEFIYCENKLYNELYEKYGITDLLISEPKHSLEPINELYKNI